MSTWNGLIPSAAAFGQSSHASDTSPKKVEASSVWDEASPSTFPSRASMWDSADGQKTEGNTSYGSYIDPPDPDIDLSESGLRNVAGHVSRRADRAVGAEPAPANSHPRANHSWARQGGYPSKRHGAQPDGVGDDSDSDSDDEHRRRGSLDDDSENENQELRRRKPKFSLTQERDWGMLRKAEEEWSMVQDYRSACQDQGKMRRRALIRFDQQNQTTAKPSDSLDLNLEAFGRRQADDASDRFKTTENDDGFSSWFSSMRRLISRLEHRYYDLLDEALWNVEEDTEKPKNAKRYPFECLQETIERVEMRVLGRCRDFDTTWAQHSQDIPENLQAHLVHVIKCISKAHWDRSNASGLHSSDSRARASALLWAMIERHREEKETVLTTHNLVDAFISNVITTIEQASSPNLKIQESHLQSLYKLILESRSSRYSTVRYSNWICSEPGPAVPAEFELCCLRAASLGKYRDLAKSPSTNIEQVFLEDIPVKGAVSLVTFKGAAAIYMETLSVDDLYIVGWFRDDGRSRQEYWRFKLDRDLTHNDDVLYCEYIFKINMDGQTLGMFTKSGDFIHWHDSMEQLLL